MRTNGLDYTVEELIITRIAREFVGEVVAMGATICSDLAARLAKRLHNPDLLIFGGNFAAWDCDIGPKLLNDEFIGIPSSRSIMDWRQTFNIIANGKLTICIGPVQLDAAGNSNISVIGSWNQPKVQLVGARGIPDDQWGVEQLHFHVKSHTPRTFVERVDFVCSQGNGRDRQEGRLSTGAPGVAVSNLGVFDWATDSGRMRVRSLHPGVTIDSLNEQTGFVPEGFDTVSITEPPSEEELYIIRNEIDPLGVRRLESVNSPPDLLAELIEAEKEFFASAKLGSP